MSYCIIIVFTSNTTTNTTSEINQHQNFTVGFPISRPKFDLGATRNAMLSIGNRSPSTIYIMIKKFIVKSTLKNL